MINDDDDDDVWMDIFEHETLNRKKNNTKIKIDDSTTRTEHFKESAKFTILTMLYF